MHFHVVFRSSQLTFRKKWDIFCAVDTDLTILYYMRDVGNTLDMFQRGPQLDALLSISKDIQLGNIDLPNDIKCRSPGEIILDGLVMPRTKTNEWYYPEQLYNDENTRHLP